MRSVLLFALLVGFLPFSALQGAVIGVSSSSSLQNQGVIDWGNVGAVFSNPSTPINVTITGLPTYSAMITNPTGPLLERRDQGTGWNGNFGVGEELLWTTNDGGAISIDFGTAVAGAGAQIQANFYGPFVGTITAFDASNTNLGSFSFNGQSTALGDDSAIFIGVLSDVANIKRVVFNSSVTNLQPDDFAINNVIVQATPNTGVVPEPASIAIFGIGGICGLVIAGRKMKK